MTAITAGTDFTVTAGRKVALQSETDTAITAKKDIAIVAKDDLRLSAADSLNAKIGSAELSAKKDGTVGLKGKDITIDGTGKINVKAGGDLTLKGAKIREN